MKCVENGWMWGAGCGKLVALLFDTPHPASHTPLFLFSQNAMKSDSSECILNWLR